MELGKEIRYQITDNQIDKIKKITKEYKTRIEMLDITCGYEGFDSYSKYGFICRVRKKGNDKTLEVKKYFNDKDCLEQSIKLEKEIDGINYLKLIGMEPYLYLKRFREVRLYKNLKIFIDEFDLIGNYVEIEYQDSNDVKKELEEFIKKKLLQTENYIIVEDSPKDMYGKIIQDNLTEEKFKNKFETNLNLILNDLNN